MSRIVILAVLLLALLQTSSADRLPGWKKHRSISVDNTKIYADLTNYPLALVIGTGSGMTTSDVSSIFDEIGTNWLQIAVTRDDAKTQLYVEKELWDAGAERGVLWVSGADWIISSNSSTMLYFNYDCRQPPNTNYVGAAGSRPQVWHSDFMAVWHLGESGNGTAGEFGDSTTNNNDATGGSGNPARVPDMIAGQIGNGQDFDNGTTDEITLVSAITSLSGAFSMSCWYSTTVNYADGWGGQTGNSIIFQVANKLCWQGPGININNGDARVIDGNWHYVVMKREDDNTLRIYFDGAHFRSGAGNADVKRFIRMGNTPYLGPTFPGTMDEMRVCHSAYSAAWIKADYESQSDNVLTWGEEQLPPSGTILLVK